MSTGQVSDSFQRPEARGLRQVCGGSVQSEAEIRSSCAVFLLRLQCYHFIYLNEIQLLMSNLINYV